VAVALAGYYGPRRRRTWLRLAYSCWSWPYCWRSAFYRRWALSLWSSGVSSLFPVTWVTLWAGTDIGI